MHCGGGCNECGWFNDNAFDEVKEMLKPICNRVQQVVNRHLQANGSDSGSDHIICRVE